MRKKKVIVILTTCIILLLGIMLTGCGSLSDDEIIKDIQEETTISQYSAMGEERYMSVEKINIDKRMTEGKEDTIYAEIIMEDEKYQRSSYYILYYNKYSEGGWILDNYERYQDDVFTVLDTADAESVAEAEAVIFLNEMAIENYTMENNYEDELKMSLVYSFTVNEELKFCSHEGVVNVSTDFEYSNDYCNWAPNLHDDITTSWNITGEWGAEYVKMDSDTGIAFDRDSIVLEVLEVGADQVNIGKLYNIECCSSYSGEYYFDKQNNKGWTDADITNEYVKIRCNYDPYKAVTFYPDYAVANFSNGGLEEEVELLTLDEFYKLPVDLILYYPEKKQLCVSGFYASDKEYYSDCIYANRYYDESGDEVKQNIYNLEKRYSTLAGTINLGDADSDTPCSMKIYGDGKLLYEFNGFENGAETAEFSVDVTGVNELALQMRNDYTTYGNLLKYEVPVIYLTEAVLAP